MNIPEAVKADWTRAFINDLPNSSFLYIEPGGKKDEDGKTTPRSLRHLPVRNKEGAVDQKHVANALSRLGQPATGKGWLTAALRKKLIAKAERLLKKKSKKAENLDELTTQIRNRFYAEAIQPVAPVDVPAGGDVWVREVWDEWVIMEVSSTSQNFKVPYTKNDDDEITFADRDEWIEVERVWKEIKAIPDAPSVGTQISKEEVAAKGAPSGDPDVVKAQVEIVIPEDNCGIPAGLAIKALGQHRIGGYAALWGGPDRKDLVEEYFTPETGEMLNVYDAVGKLPLFYHHGADETMKASVVGLVDVMLADDVGLWYEAEMKKGNEYRDAIAAMIAERSLHTSTGCLPGHRKAANDGWLERWCIVDVSMTQTPMEYRMLERPLAELKDAYKAAGLQFPETNDGEGADEEARRQEIAVELERLALLDLEAGGLV